MPRMFILIEGFSGTFRIHRNPGSIRFPVRAGIIYAKSVYNSAPETNQLSLTHRTLYPVVLGSLLGTKFVSLLFM
jgi:hypothetical protein